LSIQSNIYIIRYEDVGRLNNQIKLEIPKSLSRSKEQYSDIYPQATGTSKKTTTIVFWDISGISKLTKLFYLFDCEYIIIEFLEVYYRTARSIIVHNNGVWDKTIGDGIMSWFGFFEENVQNGVCERDSGAWDAINAAIELRNSFQNLKDKVKSKWGLSGASLDFDLKCGINTGQAHIGLVYDQVTAMGTNVNIANRLQEFAKGDQIIISNSTKEKVCSKGFDLRRISVDLNNPIKSFEDIDCCYQILF
jgi:adenylate cyclase